MHVYESLIKKQAARVFLVAFQEKMKIKKLKKNKDSPNFFIPKCIIYNWPFLFISF